MKFNFQLLQSMNVYPWKIVSKQLSMLEREDTILILWKFSGMLIVVRLEKQKLSVIEFHLSKV
jgi:hypothetical protein